MFEALTETVYRDNRAHLFDLVYRLTGSVADAEDVVQETFVRAAERPPASTDRPWRPWLVRVALNLGKDLLRGRRRRYPGTWLPAPLEADDVAADGRDAPDARYGRVESASVAFLAAIEALPPKPRAVLILRDAFSYSVREAADALSISEADVKVSLHRARRVLEGYDRTRPPLDEAGRAAAQAALERLLAAIAGDDVAQVEACLAASVRSRTDAGGEFHAAHRLVEGRWRVARLLLGLARKTRDKPSRFDVRLLNGLPALVIEIDGMPPRFAPRVVMRCALDAEGRIETLETVLATRKLAGLRP